MKRRLDQDPCTASTLALLERDGRLRRDDEKHCMGMRHCIALELTAGVLNMDHQLRHSFFHQHLLYE